MTKEEFMEKYGSVTVKFQSYYKYTFMFKGTLEDGTEVYAGIGGDADNIYRLDLSRDEELTVASLDPYMGDISVGGKTVDGFYDY